MTIPSLKLFRRKKKSRLKLNQHSRNGLSICILEKVLEKTQSAYESGKQPKIIEKANGFLREMTHGRYTLTVSSDGKDIGIIDKDNQVRDPKIWSSGTGDQVYLAIRLAMALSFGEQIEPLPIVLDDISSDLTRSVRKIPAFPDGSRKDTADLPFHLSCTDDEDCKAHRGRKKYGQVHLSQIR